jgi:predicted  nucleic acid-binding Zn-ribbon protein
MNPDLERLIALQRLESEIDEARRALDALPARHAALEAGVADQTVALDSVRQRASDNAATRRELDRELAAVQTRLRRYKDQLMEVKTNKEYLAMQHEIATAEQEVARIEDRLLERLLEADTLAGEVKAAETSLAAGRAEAADQRAALDAERRRLETLVDEAGARRRKLAADMSAEVLALFDHIRSRRGTAVAEVRDGHCSVCHVRLRPQFYNEIRRSETIFQCESCGRVLFIAPQATTAPPSA